ncbi:MAG: hypothetical protein HQM03_03030 [Magnetococcales bacterium]|nr:hypothetical protein [Magnetococcales bacterium]
MKKKKNPVLPVLWRIGSITRVSHCCHSLNLLITSDPEKQPLIHAIVRVGFRCPTLRAIMLPIASEPRSELKSRGVGLSQDSIGLGRIDKRLTCVAAF